MPKVHIKVMRGDGSHYFTEADVRADAVDDVTRHEGVTKGPAPESSSVVTKETTVQEAAKRTDEQAPERLAEVQTTEDKENAKTLKEAAKSTAPKRARRTVKRGGRKAETTTRRRETR